MGSRDHHTLRLLSRIETEQVVTQRSLSKDLGIALGLTNLLIRRVAMKGWVKIVNIRPNRVRYLITPAGIIEKSRITRDYLDNTVRLYTETRERIRASLQVISHEWSDADRAGLLLARVDGLGAGKLFGADVSRDHGATAQALVALQKMVRGEARWRESESVGVYSTLTG